MLSAAAYRSLATLLLLAAAGCGFLPISRMSSTGTELLQRAPKPTPVDVPLGDCGEAGAQPDYELNRLKNRVDEGTYLPVPWRMIAELPWPREVGFRFRHQWTSGEKEAVARFEGAAVQVEGYLVGYKLEVAEPPNCYSTAPLNKDYHLWLSQNQHATERQSIVIELTPRVRRLHPGWTEERLAALVRSQAPVRISGWLMMDQMHPENVGRNRATLWEVHPTMRLEWQNPGGQWIVLDQPGVAPP